jgi:hypothetical protein
MVITKHAACDLKTAESSSTEAEHFAAIGTKPLVAKISRPDTITNAPAVVTPLMAPKNAVWQRRLRPLTPLVADRWETDLHATNLLCKYPHIPSYIRCGAYAGIPRIYQLYTPLNKQSTEELKDIFNEMIRNEFDKGRYLGPFSQEALEKEIGPFQ